MNRKKVMLLACLTFIGLGLSPAHSQETKKGAVVMKDQPCGVLSFDEEGNLDFTGFVTGKAVQAANPSGNILVRCRGQLPSYKPSKTVVLDYSSLKAMANVELYCGLPFEPFLTDNWQQVITPSGQATLTCHLNGSSKK